MSVITAPEATKNSAELPSRTQAIRACRRSSRACQSHTSHSTSTPSSQCGRRLANSLAPSRSWPPALSQKASGGLPQNGTPTSYQGVIQSPSSAIFRATSP